MAKLDKKRNNKGSNKDGRHPHDPDAKITKMKNGRTHLAHKAEQAVDLETGAVLAVTLEGADQGDTTTLAETLMRGGGTSGGGGCGRAGERADGGGGDHRSGGR